MTNTPNRYSRQGGLVSMDILETPITVIGAGAIGSFTTLALAKCGFHNIVVFDDDLINEENISNQFYRMSDIGERKVDALKQMIHDFEEVDIIPVCMRWISELAELSQVVVCAVDNMATRREVFQHFNRSSETIAVVDGRMGGNQLEVYTYQRDVQGDTRRYLETLVTDAEAEDTPCAEKAVMYNVLTIASWIVNQVRLVLSGKEYERGLILDLENMTLIQCREREEVCRG